MGIGGGFLLVPMLIYFLRVPTATVIGTSMVLTFVTMASATVLHAATNHLVDAVLALILMVGGVIGAQFGAHAGQRIRGERLRLLLGLLVLAVGLRFAFELVLRPDDLYSIRLHRRRAMMRLALAARCSARWPCSLGGGAAGRAPSGWSSSLSNHRVMITSSFTGVELVLFGSIERDAAQPSPRRGPTTSSSPSPDRARRCARGARQRVLGIWVNTRVAHVRRSRRPISRC